MKDQVDTLRECGVPAACISSLQNYAERRETEASLARGELRMLYVSPERAVKAEFFSLLKKTSVSLIAVDEAHCISQWGGHEFRPEYRELAQLIREFPQAPVVALTATATPAVQNDIIAQLHLRRPPRRVTGSFYRKNLRYEVRPKKDTKGGAILSYLRNHRNQTGIIYCLSARGGWRNWQTPSAAPTSVPCPTMRDSPGGHGKRHRRHLSATGCRSSSPPSPSGWALTSRTCGLSFTMTCPPGR